MVGELQPRPEAPPPAPAGPPSRPTPGWPAALALLVTIGGAVGFVVAYIRAANTQWLAGTMALVFLGLGVALAYWGRDLSDDRPEVDRYPLPPEPRPEEHEQLAAALHGDVEVITRRRFLSKLLIGGAAVAGLSQLALLFSLGPKSRGLRTTAWRAGSRLVTSDGVPVSRSRLTPGGFVVAFPEGHTDAADSQIVLLHLPTVAPLPGRESWSPDGFYAYSRVCTHAGCVVAQYEDESQVLYCPCHQSTFDLRQGCKPVSGPAARPLPQLPLTLDGADGLMAQRDFDVPIGPGFWNMYG